MPDEFGGIPVHGNTDEFGGVAVATPTPHDPSFLEKVGSTIGDVATGAGKSAMGHVFSAGDLIRRGEMGIAHSLGVDPAKIPQSVRDFFGLDRVIDRPEVQAGITPQGTAQKVGAGLETAAEYLAPAAIAGKIAAGSSLAARMAAQGVAAGATNLAQTESPKSALGAGAIGAAGPAVGAGISAMASKIPTGSLAADIVGLVSPRAAHGLRIINKIKGALPSAAEEAMPEANDLLDQIAQGLGEKDFNSLGAAGKETVRKLATQVAEGSSKGIPAAESIANHPVLRAADFATAPEASAVPESTPAVSPASSPSPEPVQPSTAPSPVKFPVKARRMAQRLLDDIQKPNASVNEIAATPEPTTATAAIPEPVAEAPSSPAPATKTNPYESNARTQKSSALANFLYMGGHGVPPEDAQMMNPEHWRMAAKAAGVNEPSPTTVKQAIGDLKKLWDMDSVAQKLKTSMQEPQQ